MSHVPLYDALAADYDRFVNWPARLAHELPFLLGQLEECGARRVLDAACGSGQHAIALAERGYRVVGADLSAPMVARARENAAAAGVAAQFVVGGLGSLAGRVGADAELFDAALCLGNSLPHVLTADGVAATLADLAAVLRPGGLLVIQNRNLDRVWARRERFMPPQVAREGDREWLFVRFYDFGPELLTFNMLRLTRTAEGWSQDVDATTLRPIFAADLAAGLAAAGFDPVRLHGGYDATPFDPETSNDLLVAACRS